MSKKAISICIDKIHMLIVNIDKFILKSFVKIMLTDIIIK